MVNQNKGKFIPEEKVQQLLSFIKSKADSARKIGTSRAVIDEIIVLLLIKSGLRAIELCKLKIKDIPGVHNDKTICIRDKTDEVVRKIEISEDLFGLLTRFIKLYRKKANKNDFLLESERGNPLCYMSLYSKVRRIGEDSGIGKLSPAILRHTYVIRLYDAKQDLRYVQEQAGYSNRRTIAKYVKVNQINRNLETTQKCEACGVKIPQGSGKRIESGQLLCHECQKYFHSS